MTPGPVHYRDSIYFNTVTRDFTVYRKTWQWKFNWLQNTTRYVISSFMYYLLTTKRDYWQGNTIFDRKTRQTNWNLHFWCRSHKIVGHPRSSRSGLEIPRCVLSTFDGGDLNFWTKVCSCAVMVFLGFFYDTSVWVPPVGVCLINFIVDTVPYSQCYGTGMCWWWESWRGRQHFRGTRRFTSTFHLF
jgi:hypothetical protein